MFLFNKKLSLINKTFSDENIDNTKCKAFYKHLYNFESNDNIISNNVYRDLEIFEDFYDNTENSIFNKINKNKTISGEIYLHEKLRAPTNSIELLEKQQNELKIIINNKLFLKEKLESIVLFEKNLLTFCETIDEQDIVIGNTFINFKPFSFLNNNEQFLNFYNNYNIFAPVYSAISPILIILIPFLLSKLLFFKNIDLNKYTNIIKFATFGIPALTFSMKPNVSNIIKTIFGVLLYLFSLYNSTSFSFATQAILKKIHSKLVNLKKYLSVISEIHNKFKNQIELPNEIHEYKQLNNSIFDKKFSLISNKGTILKVYKHIKENNSVIKKSILLLGKIDYLYGLSHLITENNYSLVKYIRKTEPSLFIKNFYHPFIDKAVKNSIDIGFKEKQNVLLTGPNAGGKSTLIKTLCLSVVLAQTIGIVSAENMLMTPFHYINSYINIVDVKGRKSLFENEMERILNHINKLKTLRKNEFSFIIIDELFSGTNPKEGIASSYAIGETLSNYNNSISIITTHFNYLTNLKDYKNYKMEMFKSNNGSDINFTYKLKPGKSKDTIAIDLLKNKNFDNSIVEKALEIKKKLN